MLFASSIRHVAIPIVASLCFVGVSRAAPGEPTPPDSAKTLAEFQQLIASAAPGHDRSIAFFTLVGRIDDGQLELEAGPELDAFVGFLVGMLDRPHKDDYLQYAVASFLAKHPHPAARDALWRGTANERLRSIAQLALVALRDERVLDLLLDDVRPGSRFPAHDAFRMIGELGSPRAIPALEKTAADTSQPHAYREAARRALRDVRSRVDSGIVIPFDLDDDAHAALGRHGFVILPELENELYEHLGSEYPYITVDVVFHALMILVRSSFDDLERFVLRPRLETFASSMTRACLAQTSRLRPEREVQLAYRNAALFAVVEALLHGGEAEGSHLPRIVTSLANDELLKIRAHDAVAPSSLFQIDEDFTKYRPRARHGTTPEAGAYFQAMLVLGRMTFRIEDEAETRRALLLMDVLESDASRRRQWAEIDELLARFFGELDDPGVKQYEAALQKAMPARASGHALAVVRDRTTLESFRTEIRTLAPPAIQTMVPQGLTRSEVRGFRIFGQRYTRANDVFQQWMEKSGSLPSGLHVASLLLGSEVAERILLSKGQRATRELVSLPSPPADPIASLAEGHLHCFSPLFQRSEDRPAFMNGPAWETRLINSSLGAWAEVVHATMLYAKDANEYAGSSAMLDRFHGYVDPYPEFFSRLGQLTDVLVQSLEGCGHFDALDSEVSAIEARITQLPEAMDSYEERTRLTEESTRATREMYADFRGLVSRLEGISRKGLRGEAQTVADGVFLKGLNREFKRLAFNVSSSDHARQSMALVSDPATEYQARQCLEVGVGRALAMYVAVPFEGSQFVCKGPVYSYYEFTRSIEDRLEDEAWRRLSNDIGTDPLPWIAEFPDAGFTRQPLAP